MSWRCYHHICKKYDFREKLSIFVLLLLHQSLHIRVYLITYRHSLMALAVRHWPHLSWHRGGFSHASPCHSPTQVHCGTPYASKWQMPSCWQYRFVLQGFSSGAGRSQRSPVQWSVQLQIARWPDPIARIRQTPPFKQFIWPQSMGGWSISDTPASSKSTLSQTAEKNMLKLLSKKIKLCSYFVTDWMIKHPKMWFYRDLFHNDHQRTVPDKYSVIFVHDHYTCLRSDSNWHRNSIHIALRKNL